MKIRSADLETIWSGAQYEHEAGRLPRWRFLLIRGVYVVALSLMRELAQ